MITKDKIKQNIEMQKIIKAGVVGAVYAVLTIVFAPISYGAIQVRFSEALTVLPYFGFSYVWGITLGCLIANIYGGYGLVDIIGGSLCTFIAGVLTYFIAGKLKAKMLAPLPPVIVNAFGVSLYLHAIANLPYWLTVLYIALGEFVACYLVGYPFLIFLDKRFRKLLKE